MISVIFKHEWVKLIRSKAKVCFLVLVILIGLYSIHYGNMEIERQKKNIAVAEHECKKYKFESIKNMDGDTSLWHYKLATRPGFARWKTPYPAALYPSSFSSLSLGHRDLSPYFHNLTGLSFYMQLYRPEISNPHKLLAGNFDLGFVVIFLLPLVIVALTFDLISGEKEMGTFPMLVIQSRAIGKPILLKLLFYFLLVCLILHALICTAFVWSGIFWDALSCHALLWVFTATIYVLFWFALMLLILTFHKTSSFNAFVALSCWTFLLVILPSFINTLTASNTYISNTHLSGFTRRRSFSDHSEAGMSQLIREFIKRHPKMLKDSSIILSGDKGGKAYAAFVEQADMEAYPVFEDYKTKVMSRNAALEWFAALSPAVNAQTIFNKIAGSDRLAFFMYQDALRKYHLDIVDYYQYKIFYNVRLTKEDYRKGGPVFQFKPTTDLIAILSKVVVLCSVVVVTLTIAIIRLKRGSLRRYL